MRQKQNLVGSQRDQWDRQCQLKWVCFNGQVMSRWANNPLYKWMVGKIWETLFKVQKWHSTCNMLTFLITVLTLHFKLLDLQGKIFASWSRMVWSSANLSPCTPVLVAGRMPLHAGRAVTQVLARGRVQPMHVCPSKSSGCVVCGCWGDCWLATVRPRRSTSTCEWKGACLISLHCLHFNLKNEFK